VGWGDRGSPAFHSKWLATNGFPLDRCQQCHGQDYGGGAVGVSCAQAGCHTQAPTACTTCHGSNGTPRPATGAHWAHQAFCDTCHVVPDVTQVQEHASAPPPAAIRFSGLALQGGAAPSFDPNALQCANTYCHGALSPVWTTPQPIQCDGCHGAPPANHARWSRLITGVASCATCHPTPPSPTHVNGTVDLTIPGCTTCHGGDGHANPPVALDGTTSPTSPGVGAHDRHLNPALPDRISAPRLCTDCHVVPSNVTDPGHIDQSTTQVRLPAGGAYDPPNQTCNVWCHFNRTPGPKWTDDTGDARACNACHDYPPKITRAGTPHPSVAPDVTVCKECHVFTPETHVNGVTDLITVAPP
jgi:predicted CxxxxCH...CXXCH cytochrome family protein